MQSISAEQLMKTHCLATTLAKSLMLSVFPELTGPSITTPRFCIQNIICWAIYFAYTKAQFQSGENCLETLNCLRSQHKANKIPQVLVTI
jgi:hypothetical protein